MNIHAVLDSVSTTVGSSFVRSKYFREGTETSPLKDHLKAMAVDLPAFKKEGDYDVKASSLAGELDALFRIAQWKGDDYPTVIYHHGAAETPFDFGFKRIFPHKKHSIKANLILIRAPFHASMGDFKAGMTTLNNFMAMLATSIRVIEELITRIRRDSSQPVLVSGTSLGGYISNFHHIYYDSATVYAPLLAGLNLYDTLFLSVYSKAVTDLNAGQKKEIKSMLDFTEEFAACQNSNVYPLLGEYDLLVRYRIQKESYGDCPVKTFPRSHVTGSLATGTLREHILGLLESR